MQNTHTTENLEMSIRLQHFLDFEINPEYPEPHPQALGEPTNRTHRVKKGLKPSGTRQKC